MNDLQALIEVAMLLGTIHGSSSSTCSWRASKHIHTVDILARIELEGN